MPSCSIINCSNSTYEAGTRNKGISYHSFPKGPYIKNKWIEATGRKNWFPTKNHRICSIHFDEDDFTGLSKYRRLIPTACPTIDVVFLSTNKKGPSTDEPTTDYSKDQSENDSSGSGPQSPNVDSPVRPASNIVKRLMNQRTRLVAALKLEKMKVKRFREQNRRKDKKITYLQNIIFDMKKKMMNNCKETEHEDNENDDSC